MHNVAAEDTPDMGDFPKRGTQLGQFQVVRALGSDSLGQTLVVHDLLDPTRGLLTLRRVLEGARAKAQTILKAERALRSLEHARLARFEGCELVDEHAHVLSEYVPGVSLGTLLQEHHRGGNRGGLPPWLVVEIGLQCADALSYLHGRGLAHGNLGIEHIFTTTHAAEVLQSGEVDLKILDVALGVFRGDASPARDVFALGWVLATLLCGEAPQHGHDGTLERAVEPGSDLEPQQWSGAASLRARMPAAILESGLETLLRGALEPFAKRRITAPLLLQGLRATGIVRPEPPPTPHSEPDDVGLESPDAAPSPAGEDTGKASTAGGIPSLSVPAETPQGAPHTATEVGADGSVLEQTASSEQPAGTWQTGMAQAERGLLVREDLEAGAQPEAAFTARQRSWTRRLAIPLLLLPGLVLLLRWILQAPAPLVTLPETQADAQLEPGEAAQPSGPRPVGPGQQLEEGAHGAPTAPTRASLREADPGSGEAAVAPPSFETRPSTADPPLQPEQKPPAGQANSSSTARPGAAEAAPSSAQTEDVQPPSALSVADRRLDAAGNFAKQRGSLPWPVETSRFEQTLSPDGSSLQVKLTRGPLLPVRSIADGEVRWVSKRGRLRQTRPLNACVQVEYEARYNLIVCGVRPESLPVPGQAVTRGTQVAQAGSGATLDIALLERVKPGAVEKAPLELRTWLIKMELP